MLQEGTFNASARIKGFSFTRFTRFCQILISSKHNINESSKKTMLKPLTSLRFFFAMMVFTRHLNFVDPANKFYDRLYWGVFAEGYLGVSFFFILSGFILAYNYKTKFLTNKVTLKQFWVARFARIYPLHFITFLLSIPLCLSDFARDAFTTSISFVANIFLLHSFIPVRDVYFSFNATSWSISDEMFFYLVFPLLILTLYRKPKNIQWSWLLLLAIPLLSFVIDESWYQSLFYINPIFRVMDFFIGILLFEMYERRYFAVTRFASVIEISAILLFAVFFLYHDQISQVYRYSFYYWIPMSVIIYVFAYRKGILSKILSNDKLVLLGEISFGFYLLHQLVIRYFEELRKYVKIPLGDYTLMVVLFVITLVLSYFSYKLLEKPLNKYLKEKLK
jgi:peptidoglycan/LPS O-acetylase OafA/YrhL